MNSSLRILDSARKHGISDETIRRVRAAAENISAEDLVRKAVDAYLHAA